MDSDLPPEGVVTASDDTALTIEEALNRPDPSTEPAPPVDDAGEEMPGTVPQAAHDYSGIRWPEADRAPDYAWIAGLATPAVFDLTAETIEALLRLNRYVPSRETEVIAFALRGASLVSGHSATKAGSVAIKVTEPDHRNFRCVIGFYFHGERKLSAFTGSTVPCRKAVFGSKHGGDPSNMLLTGMYSYYVWRHKTLTPALRLAKSKADLESGAEATVLRNSADLMLDTADVFDPSTPLDNIHCSYLLGESSDLGAQFSSWGCLTVRGTKAPSDEWKMFQKVLSGVGLKSRVDLMLTTGKEAAIVVDSGNNPENIEEKLGALRQGSRGEEVKRVQVKLGIDASGFWGPITADKFTARQRALNQAAGKGRVADGIYGRSSDALTGWKVFAGASA
ncbi:hypothetical protein [Methylobacterium trifolii]|uniref:Uncharacterized protein n=1 Tax=Methylobacterium trifolii TaxID=1003092 RepID=A0ABQ4U557_9HYPH|nr:hypothetical protein [Methylobacterium trifolii]GJE62044.1 hypothetical protein MPOCJGCO_4173 [Methylobacterium trifolii]